jgi:hypothetical protein
MSRFARRVLTAAAVGALALTTMGSAGDAAGAAAGAPQSLGPPSYDGVSSYDAGYTARGRWFRFVSATLTVAARTVADPLHSLNGGADIALSGRPGGAVISVAPGGGTGSIWWAASYHGQLPFRLAPRVGDRLALSIFYDQRGHDYFTVTDITGGATQTVRVTVGDAIYSQASLTASVDPAVTPPPAADTRLWAFTGTRLTTYTGAHGTLLGPWTTSALIDTSTGTSSGRVAASPSGLSNNDQDFGIWLRALPLGYTDGLAGYEASGGRWFRFVSTTLTVPAATQPASAGDVALIWLGQRGATPRAYATITVRPGGGAGSISYAASYGPRSNAGTFAISPKPGDRLAVSVYYDRQGHDYFTASDLTQAVARTARVNADLAGTAYTTAVIGAEISNSAVTPPPADTRLWDFSGSHVTTYSGDKGTILGPWATSEIVDTINASTSGAVVMSPSVLSNGGQNFGTWLRHQ